MTPVLDSRAPHKLLATRIAKLRLAAVSGAILGIGALLAPQRPPTGLSTPQEHVAPILSEQVQVREVPRPFRGVHDVALRVRDQGVAITSRHRPIIPTVADFPQPSPRSQAAGFGVFISDTQVLTHALAFQGGSAATVFTTDGDRLSIEVAAYDPQTGLLLLRTPTAVRPPAPVASEPASPGTLAVAVARWDGRDVVLPVFVTAVTDDRYELEANTSLVAGMPLYNLDGELFAISAGGSKEAVAIPVREALNRLTARGSIPERRASFGLAFQNLTGSLIGAFGDRGVLITDVVPAGPADAAGVQPGDVLLSLGAVQIDTAEAAVDALASAPPGSATMLRTLRNGRVRDVEVTPGLAYEVAALARARRDDGASAPDAHVVFSATVLDRAGLPSTARVLSVGGRTVSTPAQAQRELRRSRQAVPVLLEIDGTRFFAAIEQSR